VEELARHFYQGEMWEPALRYSIEAGDRARKLYANQEAIVHYTHALSLLQPEDDRTARVLMHLGDVYRLLADDEHALDNYRQALVIWERLGDQAMMAGAHYAIAQCHLRAGSLDDALHHARRGLSHAEAGGLKPAAIGGHRLLARCFHLRGEFELMRASIARMLNLAEEAGDPRGLAECYRLSGNLSVEQGDYRQALEHDLRAAALFQEVEGYDDRKAMLHNNIAVKHLSLGDAQSALRHARRGMALAQRSGAITAEGWLCTTLGEIYTYLGQWEEAKAELTKGLELARKVNNRQLEAVFHGDLGLVARAEGDEEGAVAQLERALAMATEAAPHIAALWSVHLAEVYVDRRDLKRAQDLVEEGLAMAQKHGQRPVIGFAYRALGRLEWAKGKRERAAEAFQESLAVFREPENRLEAARTLCEYGRMLMAAGDAKRGHNLLQEALQVFTALGAEADADRVRLSLGGRQVHFRLASQDAPVGRPLRGEERVTVSWIVDAGPEDEVLRRREGKVALRRARILRLLAQAAAQGGDPTEADLAQALGVSVRTIRSDVAALRQAGHRVRTRGSRT